MGVAGTQWAYELSGWINNAGSYSPYTEAGTFTVDGNGNITGGADDFWGNITSGTYSVSSNGTGTINLNTTTRSGLHSQALAWGITLASPSAANSPGSFGVIEADSFASSAGAAYQQNLTALKVVPSGTFVFRTHAIASGSSIAGAQDSVGLFTFNGNDIISGYEDWVNGGVASGQFSNFSGTITAPASTGIGTISFTDGLGPRTFDYFVIDSGHLLLYETDAANVGLGLGRAEALQLPTGGFTNASLSGSFAFGSIGDTSASGAWGINTVGQFATDGNGNLTGGSVDSVRDGTEQLAQTVTSSSYSVAANGRVTLTLSTSVGGNTSEVLYLVSPTRGFFLVTNDLTLVEDGTVNQQSTTSFANSTFNGQYAFVMGGSVASAPLDRTGTLTADGNGNLAWAEAVNSAGSQSTNCLSGTYSVAANGRATASVSSLSNNLVFYLISPNSGYALQGDSGAQMPGAMANQDHQIMLTGPALF